MLKLWRPRKSKNKYVRRHHRLAYLIIVAIIALAGVWGLRHWYTNNLRPVSSSQATVYFTVSTGETKTQIAQGLQTAHLIRSAQAFSNYLRSNEINVLEAGTYKFSPSMSVQQIVHAMVIGDVAKNLLTILPGKRLDQIEQAFKDAGYSQSDIDTAFNPATYAGDPDLSSLPAGASLEGYLYPDSFQKEVDTPASTIVKESLDEMQGHLSDDIVNGFGAQGLSVYKGVTLASIIAQESGNSADQPCIAEVFLNRINQGMDLQSDVTADYAAALAGVTPSTSINSPYNTYLHSGLPPGPISNVTASALSAVAHPASSSYLYFIAGDDGKIHYASTVAEHNQQIQQYCAKSCVQP